MKVYPLVRYKNTLGDRSVVTIRKVANELTGRYDYVTDRVNSKAVKRSEIFNQYVSLTGDHKHPNEYAFAKSDYMRSGQRFEVYTDKGPSRPEGGSLSVNGPDAVGIPDYFGSGLLPGDEAYDQALGNFYDKVRGDLDLAIDLAEAGQVKSMIRSFTKAEKYITAIHPKKWASHWLEYQYGIRPLVNSIYGCASEIVRQIRGQKLLIVRGRGNESETNSYEDFVNHTTHNQTRKARVEIIGLYDLSDSVVANLARFTSLNPASIIWELTPYSFVFDWFLDVGSYLRNVETSLLMNTLFRGGYVTRSQSTTNIDILDYTYGDVNTQVQIHGEQRLRAVGLHRIPIALPPSPHVPRFKADLGATRLISGASLLAQRFIR